MPSYNVKEVLFYKYYIITFPPIAVKFTKHNIYHLKVYHSDFQPRWRCR